MKPSIVIVHCADTPDYEKGDPKFDHFGASDIDEWHKQAGWNCIGYHWVIRRTGMIEQGRLENVVGANCKGQNDHSLGICYIGREHMTDEQVASLNILYREIKKRHGIEIDSWYTHNHFNPHKLCPGFFMEELKTLITA